MRISFTLDPEATDRLIERAIANRRPVPLEVEVIVLQALGFTLPRLRPADDAEKTASEVQR